MQLPGIIQKRDLKKKKKTLNELYIWRESWENVTVGGYINKMDTFPASEPNAV